ncbi:MAG TPA: pitrilysin family protein [Candidatus Binataceae bacterium]|nr:pitrilysin family protein [Candidatus Binataceae bacterium]
MAIRYSSLMQRLAFMLVLACALVPAQTLKVDTFMLPNGMKVLVNEDHDIPSVALYFFYKIGARNERPGTTGLSHFFEHMMFNGAKQFGPKQFDIQMEKNGGSNNAYTSRDVTVYQDWFPPPALELMFKMEADRIRDLSFDPKMIESERGVVYSERRTSVDNNPWGALFEQLEAVSFVAHPYHFPVLGWPSDIESWTMDDLQAHFKMGYAPNNCVMVISGDVTLEQIKELTAKYLAPIPQHDPPPPVRTKEPEQLGERRLEVHRPAALPIVLVAFHIPQSSSPDDKVITVLDDVLTAGRSSRLYRRLVDQDQLVLQVGGNADNSLDPYLYVFYMQLRTGVDPKKAEAALYDELAKVVKDGVTAGELTKSRNSITANLYRQLATINGKANTLGSYEIFYGDYKKLFTVVDEISKVTSADIQQVAAKYFTAKNRTVATLIPESAAAGGDEQ